MGGGGGLAESLNTIHKRASEQRAALTRIQTNLTGLPAGRRDHLAKRPSPTCSDQTNFLPVVKGKSSAPARRGELFTWNIAEG